MQVINKACVIKAKMPPVEIIQHAMKKAEELHFKPMELGTSKAFSCGFVDDVNSCALVTKFHNGYLLHVCIEEKIVVARQVKAELDARIEQLRKIRLQNGDRLKKISRKEIAELKENILVELMTNAKTDQSYVPILVTENFIFIGTTNSFRYRVSSGLLIKLVESLTASTIYIDGCQRGITSMLKHHIDTGDNIMQPFCISGAVTLKKDTMRISYNVEDIVVHGDLVKSIDLGFEVEKIELFYGDEAVKFTLDKKYHLQKIKVFGINDDMDYVDSLNYEAMILDHMIGDFLKLFKRDDENTENETTLPSS